MWENFEYISNDVHRAALVRIENIVKGMRDANETEGAIQMVMRRVSDGVEIIVDVALLDNAVEIMQFEPSIDDPNLYWGEDLITESDDLMKICFYAYDKTENVELEFVALV